MKKYQAASALREHMLEGNPVSLLEAILLFGVQGPNAEFARMKKEGLFVKTRKVSMARVLSRVNTYTICTPPKDLPYKEITLTEYYISR